MSLLGNLKIIRESLEKSQKEMAKAMGISLTAWQNYESGSQVPGGKVFESIASLGFNLNWLITGLGPMKQASDNGLVANGNNIIQGAHIDAEELHLAVHHPVVTADPAPSYGDPIAQAFLKDWLSLDDVRKMRFWTLLKEEIARGKE